MSIFRRINTIAERLSTRLQGQDAERPDTISGRRAGGDFAAMLQSHSSQGIGHIGFGR